MVGSLLAKGRVANAHIGDGVVGIVGIVESPRRIDRGFASWYDGFYNRRNAANIGFLRLKSLDPVFHDSHEVFYLSLLFLLDHRVFQTGLRRQRVISNHGTLSSQKVPV